MFNKSVTAVVFDPNNDIVLKEDSTVASTRTSGASLHPLSYQLEQNYPNPFNPATRIEFSIADARLITLKIYDVLGKEVATLANTTMNPGTYTIPWNAGNLPSGIYFYRLRAGQFIQSKKMTLLK